MIRNYLKVALRNLNRQKIYAFINIVGLSFGLACSMLLFLWVMDELSVDKYNEKYDRIFQVMEHQRYSNGQILTTESNPGPLAPALKEEYPEVEHATRVTFGGTQRLFKTNEEYFNASTLQVDSTFFHIFTLDFIAGSRETAFDDPLSIVLTDETASRIFGDEPALGKTLEFNDRTQVTVTGIVKSRNLESSLRFDALQPYPQWESRNEWATLWTNNGIRTFVSLHPGTDWKAFSEKIKSVVKDRNEGSVVDLFLHPLADRYLRSDFREGVATGGRITLIKIFGIIGVFILVIACINFMNLATARSARRAKEIGVRKAAGANRSIIIGQFMAESFLISTVAMVFALILAEMVLPSFNQLTQKGMDIDYTNVQTWLGMVVVIFITGLLAGSYPALYMASFDTVKILKGSFRTGRSAATMRHGLVVFQFVLSFTLIVCTVFMYRQMQYMINKDLGMDKELVLYFNNTTRLNDQFEAFRTGLTSIPGVESVTRANQNPLNVGNSTGNVRWEGMTPDDAGLFQVIQVDYDFAETLKMRLLDGRSFDRIFSTDTATVMINQEAARKMGMQDPVGQTINLWNENYTIIGLLEDFHTNSLRYNIEPVIIRHRPSNAGMTIMRLAPGDLNRTLEQVREVYKRIESRVPLEYLFLDDYYESMYRRVQVIGILSQLFAGFAILISCLGLLGLASFTAEQRTKEIGVRKVLGASVPNLVMLLTGSFTRLIVLAFLISIPFTWYLVNLWLNNFAYRINLDMGTFIVSGFAIMVMAWMTVLYQCLKSAFVNPAKVLKYE